MIRKLDQKTKEILQPWYPELNLEKIKIVEGGMAGWFFGKYFKASAATIGRSIHLTKLSHYSFDEPHNVWSLSLMVHELKHVDQQREMGWFRCYVKYIFDWVRAGFKYSVNLPLEYPAYKKEQYFREYFGCKFKTVQG